MSTKPGEVQSISKGISYIDKVVDFQGASMNDVVIRANDIKSRSLDLVVPPSTSLPQREALQNLIKYGKEHGVGVNIITVQ